MTGLDKFVSWETHSSEPIKQDTITIVPQSQALEVRLPNGLGGFVWNRPVALLVTQDNITTRLPIIDQTRLSAFVMFGLSIALSVFFMIIMRLFRK